MERDCDGHVQTCDLRSFIDSSFGMGLDLPVIQSFSVSKMTPSLCKN